MPPGACAGFNNAYLKAINHAMALEHGTAEQ
jgi:hypothetical protein